MDIARQASPHSEGCGQQKKRDEREFPSMTSLLLLAMTHFEEMGEEEDEGKERREGR